MIEEIELLGEGTGLAIHLHGYLAGILSVALDKSGRALRKSRARRSQIPIYTNLT